MAITNHKHLTFILEVAKHGDPIKAYRTAYPTCKENKTAASNGGRLMKNTEIAFLVKQKATELQAMLTEKAAQELSGELAGNVLTFARKRLILADIAAGKPRKISYFVTEKGKKVKKETTIVPTNTDIAKAIELDNRMTGDFAADRRELGDIGKGAIKTDRLDDDQFSKIISSIETAYLKSQNGTQ